jgi:urease accessory protein UreF
LDWTSILNQVVYPALLGFLLIMLSIELRALAAYLKAQAAKIQNTLIREIVLGAVDGVEQQAATAEKLGKDKWSSDLKKTAAAGDALAEAKARGLAVTDEEINKLIESVLGAKK